MIASFQVIAMSDSQPKPSMIAQGISMSLISAMVGLYLSVPGYLLAVVGSFVRSLARDESRSHSVPMAAQIVESKR
jgi:biopolymer transport protein ExbB/TolQ